MTARAGGRRALAARHGSGMCSGRAVVYRAAMGRRRFLPPLPRAVLPEEVYHVAPRIGPTRAEQLILAEICDGTFRPPDAAEKATIEEAYALFVPFWRIDMARTDQALRLASVRVGSVGIPVPHQDTTEAKATWMVCARSAFPYEMKHPRTLLPGDAKPLTLSLAALEHGDPSTRGGWEVLDADIDGNKAYSIASAALARSSSASRALFTDAEITVHARHFVLYPVWFARYRYQGAASADGNDLFYVGISAADGTPITAEHPSKLRSGAARVRRFFFDD